jgi:hypothetical protein
MSRLPGGDIHLLVLLVGMHIQTGVSLSRSQTIRGIPGW